MFPTKSLINSSCMVATLALCQGYAIAAEEIKEPAAKPAAPAPTSALLPAKTLERKISITYVSKESKAAERLVELHANGDYVINVIKDNGNDAAQISRGLKLIALALAQDKGIEEKKKGNYDAAERDFALAVSEARALNSDSVLSETLRSLASVARLLKEREKSLDAYREALSLLEKTEGLQSVAAASVLDDMARVYDELNDTEIGERLHKQAIATFEKLQGPNGADLVICLYNLSDCYLHNDRFADSIVALSRALKILEARGEDSSVDYATTMDNLGGVYSDAENYDEAEKTHRKALALFLKNAGVDSIDTAICYQNLANVLVQEKKWLEAKEIYDKALKIETSIRGDGHPRVKALKAKVASVAAHATADSTDTDTSKPSSSK